MSTVSAEQEPHPALNNTPAQHKGSKPHLGRLLLGLGSLILGVIFVPIPVPLGWFFLLTGTALIAVEIAWVGRFVRWCRGRWAWGDRRLRQLYAISPQLVKDFLVSTDPEL